MRTHYLSIAILVVWLTGIGVSFTVAETEYSMGVEEDDTFIYSLIRWDEELAEDTFGSSDPADKLGENAALGSKYALVIDDIDEVDDLWSWKELDLVNGWEIDINVWEWTTEEFDFESSPDDVVIVGLFEDPDHYGGFGNLLFESELIPVPADTYLGDYNWDSEYDIHDHTVTKTDGDLIEIHEWRNIDGVLRSIEVTTEEGEIIYRLELQETLMTILISIIVAIIVAIIAILGLAYVRRTKEPCICDPNDPQCICP